MPVRSKLQRNSPLTVLVALAVLVICGVVIWRFRQQSATQRDVPNRQWFLDVGTGKLYPVDANLPAPQEPPSRATLPDGSPGGVKAYVFSCGDCNDARAQFVGYVETLPESERVKPPDMRNPSAATIARITVTNTSALGLEWLPMKSEKAEKIILDLQSRCHDGGKLTECLPPSE